MKIDRRALLLLPSMGALLAGCPDNMTGDDAFVTPTPDAFTPVTPDAYMPPGTDAGTDAFVAPDAFMPPGMDGGVDAFVADDAFVPPDAFVPLPAIVNPDPHTVGASAAGHDRLFGVTFAPDSSYYVVGVSAPGVDAATNDFSTIVGHFDADGELDTSFGTGGWYTRNVAVGLGGEVARGIGLQSDGSIVVAVTAEHVAAGADARDRDVYVFRLNADGTLDDTFGTAGTELIDLSVGEAVPAPGTGYAADSAWNLEIDEMDRITVAVGLKRTGATDTDFGILRLQPDGDRDTTFATGGLYQRDIANVNASVREIRLVGGGRTALAGYYTDGTTIRPAIIVVNAAGAPDAAFGTAGLYNEAILATQTESYAAAVQGTSFISAGYGRDLGPDDNDFIAMRIDGTTGMRDLTFGGGDGIAILTGFDFGDNARSLVVLPDDRILMVGGLRTAAMATDAALVLTTADGVFDSTFGTAGVRLVNTAGGTVDHFWSVDVDPRGERVVVVGIGGTETPTDDDALVYLFPVP